MTIPKGIREHLTLRPGDLVVFALRHGEIVTQSAMPKLQDLRSSIKPRREPEDFCAVREKASRQVARRLAGG